MPRTASRMGWIAVLLLSVSCNQPLPAMLGTPFDLRVGRAATVQSGEIDVLFRRVVSDSRCPRDVQCVRGGEAFVTIEARTSGTPRETLELCLGCGDDSSGGADHGGYRIRIVKLEPYPVSTVERDSTAYIGTFVVERR